MALTKLVLKTAGQEFKTEGETVIEALKALPIEDYTDITHKGTIEVTRGDKKFERLFPVIPLRRLFANKIYKEWWANSVEKFIN